jgi:hypothetical protein
LLHGLADGSVAISHHSLDQLDDTKTVRHVRRVLVASGVLPERDEHLHRLERWLRATVGDLDDPEHRRLVHRYADWYHLRRLRARTCADRPVTAGQAARLRYHVAAAVAVLETLRDSGRCLADLSDADVDRWLADGTAG